MKVDHVLILAAGKGTRMGEIGKIIPKVIWPIFNKTILDLEVDYAKYLAPSADVYINLFNYKEKVLKHIDSKKGHYKDVNILLEEGVLDIGGAIHNMAAQVRYNGNLLVLNSDQFLFCDPSIIEEGVRQLQDNDSLLFSYGVNSSDGYNALRVNDNLFEGVIKNSELERDLDIVTYTGMSLINLSRLEQSQGESKFFETVANHENNKVCTIKISDFEYWDFGTLKRYHDSMWKLFTSEKSKFKKFLLGNSACTEEDFKNKDELVSSEIRIKKNKILYNEIEEQV